LEKKNVHIIFVAIFDWKTRGSRKEDNIKMNVREIEHEDDRNTELAQDRI
jgi:hypothetical protein